MQTAIKLDPHTAASLLGDRRVTQDPGLWAAAVDVATDAPFLHEKKPSIGFEVDALHVKSEPGALYPVRVPRTDYSEVQREQAAIKNFPHWMNVLETLHRAGVCDDNPMLGLQLFLQSDRCSYYFLRAQHPHGSDKGIMALNSHMSDRWNIELRAEGDSITYRSRGTPNGKIKETEILNRADAPKMFDSIRGAMSELFTIYQKHGAVFDNDPVSAGTRWKSTVF